MNLNTAASAAPSDHGLYSEACGFQGVGKVIERIKLKLIQEQMPADRPVCAEKPVYQLAATFRSIFLRISPCRPWRRNST